MKIQRQSLKRQSIEEFADGHGLTMVVKERPYECRSGNDDAFHAFFDDCEVKKDCFLVSTFGNGRDEQAAIDAYRKEISGAFLVYRSCTSARREMQAPILSPYQPQP